MDLTLVTKTRLAQELGVGKSAVSNWIERGIITGDAIVGEGRSAKIKLEVAREQVRRNRDIGQSMGNGIGTRTSVEEIRSTEAEADVEAVNPETQSDLLKDEPAQRDQEQHSKPSGKSIPKVMTDEDRVRQETLEANLEAKQRKNRIEAADEARRQGLLISADDARKQMKQIAKMALQTFEGSLADYALAIAEKFGVSLTDVEHALKVAFEETRRKTHEQAQAQLRKAPQTTKIVLENSDQ